jgi:hypothetical protein
VKWRRFAFAGIVFGGLLYLNLRNGCQPGWCGTYGFPVAYYRWSDEIVKINGVVVGRGFSPVGLAVDVGVTVAAVLMTMKAWSVRRAGTHAAA